MPLRESPIDEVYAAMEAIEQAYIPAVVDDLDFQAFDFLPEWMDVRSLPYPLAFRLPPEFEQDQRRMGGVSQPLEYTIHILILVGLSSNALGPLSREASRFIKPYLALYRANQTIVGTVQSHQMMRGIMGDITLEEVTHYGLDIPILTKQHISLPSAPTFTSLP